VQPVAVAKQPNISRELESLELEQKLSMGCRRAMELVLKVGLRGIQWQKDFTALHLAAKDGHKAMAHRLLQMRADPLARDSNKMTPIDYAKQQHHMQVADILVAASGSPGNRYEKKGKVAEETKLKPASATSLELRKQLSGLDLPADLRKVCEGVADGGWSRITWQGGFTGLHLAAKAGNEAAVKFLLQAKATVALKAQDMKGRQPVDLAIAHGHAHLVPLLSPASNAAEQDVRNGSADGLEALRSELRQLRSDFAEAGRHNKLQMKRMEDAHSRHVTELNKRISTLSDEVATLRSQLLEHAATVQGLQDHSAGWPSGYGSDANGPGDFAARGGADYLRQNSIRTIPELAVDPPPTRFLGPGDEGKKNNNWLANFGNNLGNNLGNLGRRFTQPQAKSAPGMDNRTPLPRGQSDLTDATVSSNIGESDAFWGPIVGTTVFMDESVTARRASAADAADLDNDSADFGPVIRVTSEKSRNAEDVGPFADLTSDMTWRPS